MSSKTNSGKAPMSWLAIGYAGLPVLFSTSLLAKPSGLTPWTGYLVYWLISMAVYLVPFAIFSIKDLKMQVSGDLYRSSTKTVNTVRFGLLISGMVTSVYFIAQLATELSKTLNVGA